MYKGHAADRCFFPGSCIEKNRSTEVGPGTGMFFFFLCPSYSHPSLFTGVWILLILQTLWCAPSLLNCVDRSANHRTPGISLSPALLCSALSPSLTHSLFPSLSLSLSHCRGLQCSPSSDWSSFIGLTLSSQWGEVFPFVLTLSSLPCHWHPCGAVMIWKKLLLLFHRD